MKIRNAYLYLSLIIVHAILTCMAFPAFTLQRGNIMLCNWGDGLKNYFTLSSYIKEPIGSGGIFKYNSFAYPFGDYVYYTDNTPLFSIPFRWFCHHVHDVSNYTIPAFNTFIIGNIIVSALLVFFIFKRLLGKNIFSFCLAIFLPWVNIQLPRIWEGDFNLSCSTPILAAICLFIAWYNNMGNTRKQMAIAAGMVLMLFLSFLLHGYYIAIVSVFLAAMLFFLGVILFKNKEGKGSVLISIVVPTVALAAVLTLLHITDKYLSMRPQGAQCYDWAILKTNFLLLFTHYDFHTLAFPIASSHPMDLEIMVYLGNIGLFAFAGIWTGSVFSTPFRKKVFAIQKEFFSDPLKKSVFLGGLLSLVISFGEYYTTNRDRLKIYTPLPWFNNLDTNTLLVAIGLLSLLLYGAVLIANPKARENLKRIGADYVQHPYKKALLLFCIALMIYLFVGRYAATVLNILNPFFYIHFFTKEVEQFRSLSRFSWPFFWVFYIWIMFTLLQLYYQSAKSTKSVLLSLFIIVGLLEVRDYVVKASRETNKPNLFSSEQLNSFSKLKVDYKQYQSIIPIPYYIVGSEDYPHTIDDNQTWSSYTMQLSIYSRLPLMSCKMSRTPVEFTLALLDMVSNDTLQPVLKSRLTDQPILIAVNRNLVNDPSQANSCTSGREITMGYYNKANDFVNRHHLTPIDSMGSVLFYSWNPK
jgi:hypothetical protein